MSVIPHPRLECSKHATPPSHWPGERCVSIINTKYYHIRRRRVPLAEGGGVRTPTALCNPESSHPFANKPQFSQLPLSDIVSQNFVDVCLFWLDPGNHETAHRQCFDITTIILRTLRLNALITSDPETFPFRPRVTTVLPEFWELQQQGILPLLILPLVFCYFSHSARLFSAPRPVLRESGLFWSRSTPDQT